MKTYKELNEKIDRQYTSDYTLSKSGRKVHRTPMVDKDAEKVDEGNNMTIDEQINEVLSKDATAGDWIHDFVHSDNPKFEGKSKEKRKQMALAAYYAKQQNEEVELEEGDLSVRHLYNKFADAHVGGNDTKPTEKAIKKVHGDKVFAHMKKAANANAKGDMDGEERHFDNAQTAAKKTDRIGGTVGRGRSEFMRKRREWSEEVEIDENAPVAPVPDKKYIKGTPEHKAYKATKKPINGMPTNVKEGSMKSFKEMVQSIDELSKGTLGSYIKKAKGSAIGSSQVMGMGSSMTGQKTQDKAEKTVQKRASGINKAVDRLTNEEVLDESVFDNKDHAQSIANKLKKKNEDGNYNVVADHGKHRVVHAYHSDSKVKKDIAKLNEEQLDEVNQKTVALAKEIAKKHKNMTSDVSRGNVHIFNKHDDEAADRLVLAHTGTDKEGNDRFHLHRVHSSAEDSDHRNLTAAEVHKHAARHITGKSMDEEVETIEEKSEQAKQNKTMKNMMDASRGAKFKLNNPVPDAEPEHKTARAHNVAIGRALRKEGYYEKPASAYRRKGDEVGGGSSKNDAPFDGPYTKTPGTVKDKSGAVHTPMSRARDLARQAMKKQMKEDIDLFFEAKDETEYGYEGDMAISQLKTICRHAEEFMGMLKPDTDLPEWVQSKITLATDYIQTAHDYMSSEMNEALKGNQHKIDKNKNGKVDAHDFKILRGEDNVKEEVETRTLSFSDFINQLNEYNPGPGGVTRVQGRSYGAQYRDPEGEDDADDKKKQVAKSEPAVKRGRGRPAGSKSGANQKVTTGRKGSGVDYTGYKLHLPNSNR
jgi:hypothetical protein